MKRQFLSICLECGFTENPSICRRLGHRVEKVKSSLGLIGARNTGKTVYLATLHDQLMHSAPEWRVSVGDYAFTTLTNNYRCLLEGWEPSSTAPYDIKPFTITVHWKGQRLGLLSSDSPGESYYYAFGRLPIELQLLLSFSRSIFVTVGMFWTLIDPSLICPVQEEDLILSRFFNQLLQQNPALQQVIVLITGTDAWGDDPTFASQRALHDFERSYRLFTGVLKNSGVRVDPVPVSNFGFGNTKGRKCLAPPRPYNVLEPLRIVFRNYLPWWQRSYQFLKAHEPKPQVQSSSSPTRMQSNHTSSGSAFISYRRSSGSETARLIRSELITRGWDAFLDIEDLGACNFDDRLLLEIQNAENFILILSPKCLDSCKPDDWFVKEIKHALTTKRKIIPILKDGFAFPAVEDLPSALRGLPKINGIAYSHYYFSASIDKLISFLSRRVKRDA